MSKPIAKTAAMSPPIKAAEPTPLTDDEMLSSRFLALVMQASENDAELRLLYVWREKKWEHVTITIGEGSYQWRNAPCSVARGSLWVVSLEDISPEQTSDASPRYAVRTSVDPPIAICEVITQLVAPSVSKPGKGKTHPAFRPLPNANAKTLQPLSELFDDLEAIRLRFVEIGETFQPFGPVLIVIPDKCAVGPLTLRKGDDRRWRAPEGFAPVRHAPGSAVILSFDFNGVRRRIFTPEAPLPAQIAEADFRSDDAILELAIEALRNTGQPDTFCVDAEKVLAEVERRKLSAASDQSDYYLFRRAEASLARFISPGARRSELCAAILNVPETARLIQEAKTEAEEAAVESIKRNLREEREALETTRAAREREEARLNELQERARLAEAQVIVGTDVRIARIAAEVVDRVVSATSRQMSVDDTMTEIPAVRGVIARVSPHREALWLSDGSGAVSDVETLEEIFIRLKRRLEAMGFAGASAAPLLAAWLSDRIPVIAGADALRLLEVAADCLAGGRLVWIPMNAAMNTPADLFGRVHPVTGSYVPHEGRLADAVLEAMTDPSGQLALVVISGANLVDTASVLLPIFESYADAWHRGRRLPLLHPNALPEADPFHELSRAVWPRQLLLAVTYVEGASPLPPPPPFWRRTAFLLAEEIAVETAPPLKRFQVNLDRWTEMRSLSIQKSSVPADGGASRAALRFMDALAACGVDRAEAVRLWRECCEMPLTLSRQPNETNGQDESHRITRLRSALLGGGVL